MARIVVDAMGGDHAPATIVSGAVEAVRTERSIEHLILVGDESALRRELSNCCRVPSQVEIVHAAEVVGMDETPVVAVRRKKRSSISLSVDLVKEHRADALFTAGNTGAAVVATTIKLRTLIGIDRPAIATVWPTQQDTPLLLLDAGANTDCSANMLSQFAVMGSVYASDILGIQKPRIGLMSIGGEDAKGNEVTKEAFGKLESCEGLNFVGNIEGHDLWNGIVDVAVCDGFVGNVVLKTSESTAKAVVSWVRNEIHSKWWYKAGAFMCRGAFQRIREKSDPAAYGGAPLLGVNGVCIIGHGSSNERAAANGIRVAAESVQHEINPHIVDAMQRVNSESDDV